MVTASGRAGGGFLLVRVAGAAKQRGEAHRLIRVYRCGRPGNGFENIALAGLGFTDWKRLSNHETRAIQFIDIGPEGDNAIAGRPSRQISDTKLRRRSNGFVETFLGLGKL